MKILDSIRDAIVEPEPTPAKAILDRELRTLTDNQPSPVAGANPTLDTAGLLRSNLLEDSPAAKAFLGTLQSLSNYIPDKKARFQAAGETVIRMGFPIQSIVTGLGLVLGSLDHECSMFEAAKSEKESSEIDTKQKRLDEIENTIESLETEKLRLLGEVKNTRLKIEQKKKEFYAIADAIKIECNGALDNIKSFITKGN